MTCGRMFRWCFFFSLVALDFATIVSRSYQCGNQSHFTADNGIIRSHTGFDFGHDYGKNMDCVWTIEAPEGKFVELMANTFHLDGPRCSNDFLELFDGDTTNGHSLGKFCGDAFASICSAQRFLILNFVIDGIHGFRGFELFYNFTDHVIRTCLPGEFSCDNFNCVLGRYLCNNYNDCGDDSDERNCQYTTTQQVCNSDIFQCPNGMCILGRNVCDGDNGCGDMSDDIECGGNGPHDPRCGRTNFTGDTGYISSSNFPYGHPANMHCSYHVTAPAPAGTKGILRESACSIICDLVRFAA